MAKGATIKPPAEKLPLAVRKNVRDEFENKKADLEDQLTQKLGVPWTIDINPNAIYPYAEDNSYGQQSLGACLREYVEGVISGLAYFLKNHGDTGKNEINTLCSSHVLTMDMDALKKYSYNGAEVRDGKLVVLFGETYLGSNIHQTMDKLEDTLNEAPQPDGAPVLSYSARASVKTYWEENVEELQEKIAKQLHNDNIKLNPNFEAVFTKLKASKDTRDDYQKNLGMFAKNYFEGFLSTLEYNKFVDDDLLYEGFEEAVPKGEVCIRIVDKLVKGYYNESIIEDGVLYLQTTPGNYGTNVSDIASKIVELM